MKTTPEIADAAAALIAMRAAEGRQHAQTYREIGELNAAQRQLLIAQALDEGSALLRAAYPEEVDRG